MCYKYPAVFREVAVLVGSDADETDRWIERCVISMISLVYCGTIVFFDGFQSLK